MVKENKLTEKELIAELIKENQSLKNRIQYLSLKNQISVEDKMAVIKEYFEYLIIDKEQSLNANDYSNVLSFERYLKNNLTML